VKKGRHRRFEEARAMKRSHDVDLDALMESLREERTDSDDPWSDYGDDDHNGSTADGNHSADEDH
jgi:hypothetical protein